MTDNVIYSKQSTAGNEAIAWVLAGTFALATIVLSGITFWNRLQDENANLNIIASSEEVSPVSDALINQLQKEIEEQQEVIKEQQEVVAKLNDQLEKQISNDSRQQSEQYLAKEKLLKQSFERKLKRQLQDQATAHLLDKRNAITTAKMAIKDNMAAPLTTKLKLAQDEIDGLRRDNQQLIILERELRKELSEAKDNSEDIANSEYMAMLEQQIESLEQNNILLEEERDGLKNEVLSSSEQLIATQDQVGSSVKQHVSDLKKNKKRLIIAKNKQLELESSNKELVNKLALLNKELAQKQAESTKKLVAMGKKLSTAKDSKETLQQQIIDLKDSVSELKEQLNKRDTALTISEQSLNKQVQLVELQKTELNQLREQELVNSQQQHKLKLALAGSKVREGDLRTRLKNSVAVRQGQDKELEQLLSKIEKLNAKLLEEQEQKTIAQTNLVQVEQQLLGVNKQTGDFNLELEKLRADNLAHIEEQARLKQELLTVEKEMLAMEKSIANKEEERASIAGSLEKQIVKVDKKWQKKIEQYKKQLAQAEQKFSDTSSALQDSNNKLKLSEEKIQLLSSRESNSNIEKKKLETQAAKTSSCQADLESVSGENRVLTKEVAKLKNDIAYLGKVLAKGNSKTSPVEQELTLLGRKYRNVQKELGKCRTAVMRMRAKIRVYP